MSPPVRTAYAAGYYVHVRVARANSHLVPGTLTQPLNHWYNISLTANLCGGAHRLAQQNLIANQLFKTLETFFATKGRYNLWKSEPLLMILVRSGKSGALLHVLGLQ